MQIILRSFFKTFTFNLSFSKFYVSKSKILENFEDERMMVKFAEQINTFQFTLKLETPSMFTFLVEMFPLSSSLTNGQVTTIVDSINLLRIS